MSRAGRAVVLTFEGFRTFYLIVGYGGIMISILLGAIVGYFLRHIDIFKAHGA